MQSAKLSEVARVAGRTSHPLYAILHLTHRCDLACQHCFQDEESHPQHQEMSFAQLTSVMDELAAAGSLYLTFTGGEIFLRRDLMELIAAARQRRFAVILKTAGHHLNPHKAARLKELLVHEVHISLYSHLAEVSDAFTQRKGSWQRTVNGITALRDAGVRTVVRAAMTSFNFRQLKELKSFAEGLGAEVQLDPSVNVKASGDRSSLDFSLSPAQRAEALEVMGLEPGSLLRDPDAHCHGDQTFVKSTSPMCGAARTTVSIDAQGGVHACVLHPHVAGNVLTEGFAAVWEHSPVLTSIRDMTYGEMAKGTCGSCTYQRSCHPCMALSATENGSNQGCNTSSLLSAQSVRLLARRRMGMPDEALPPPPAPSGGRAVLRVVS